MATGQRDEAEVIRVRAPGIVELLGGHDAGTGGPVLAVAIDRFVGIAGVRGGTVVELRSDRWPGVVRVPVDADDAGSVEPEWGRLVAGVVGDLRPGVGLVGSITSTFPAEDGLASSSALAVAVALALGAAPDDPVVLARLAARAEQPAGPEVTLAVVLGRRGRALLIDGPALDVTPLPFPDDIEIVVVHTAQDRSSATATTAERTAECAAAAAIVGSLRSASSADLGRIADPLLRRRARHVVSEGERVRAAASALAAGDAASLGRLLGESHASARDDFEVSTPTADNIVSRLARTPGVIGARLTGAGSGGWVVALARPGTRLAPGLDATVLHPADGAGLE